MDIYFRRHTIYKNAKKVGILLRYLKQITRKIQATIAKQQAAKILPHLYIGT